MYKLRFTTQLLCFITLNSIIGCNSPKNYTASRSLPLAGEIVLLKAVAPQQKTAEQAVDAGLAEAQKWDQLLDKRLPQNQTWLNAPQNLAAVSYPPQVDEILKQAFSISYATGNLFDPLIAPITNRYQEGQWISYSDLPQMLLLITPDELAWDENSHLLTYHREGMGLDLDGIAQGYIADKSLQVMLSAGAVSALADVGGEVAISGNRSDGSPWHVGITLGNQGNEPRESANLTNGAISVSGDLTNPMIIDGKSYSHIIDPRTGRPTVWSGTVATYAPNAATADAWATALFVAGPTEGPALAKSQCIEAKWWDAAGRVVAATGNFPSIAQK